MKNQSYGFTVVRVMVDGERKVITGCKTLKAAKEFIAFMNWAAGGVYEIIAE